MKEVEELGLGGLAIVGSESDETMQTKATSTHAQHTRRQASGHWDHQGGDNPQECRKVLTASKVPMHERYKQLDYPHRTIENLMVGIQLCNGDPKTFNDRYEDEKTAYNCNMRTKLRKQFRLHQTEAAQRWKEYEKNAINRAGRVDEKLQKSYLEAMDVTIKASTLLDKEIRAKIAEDKTCYPDNRAVNNAVAGKHKNRFVVDMLRLWA